MKKNFRRAICVLCAVTAMLSSFAVSAEVKAGTIRIDTVSALNGDSVIVRLVTENNPGIMAMTISITYDSSALEYEKYYQGYLWDYTVADHPEQNMIRFVNCESWNRRDNSTMISLQFKVKDDASFGFYPISIDYKVGDFCNWKLERIMPEIVSGGIDVAFNGKNCKHKKYGEWKVAAEPGCTEAGAKQRVCEKCGHVDIAKIPAVGHRFEDNWTVDRQATEDSNGIMSRHCKGCKETTDVLTFSLDRASDGEFSNEPNATVKPSDFTDELVKEQIPEEERNSDTAQPNSSDGSQSAGGNSVLSEIKEKRGALSKILELLPVEKLKIPFVFNCFMLLRLVFI